MKKKIRIIAVALLCSLLFAYGCETTPTHEVVGNKMSACLNSCLGKLSKKALIMHASTPSEIVPVDDGEIWIYKYRKRETKVTAEGSGSILFPVEAESKTEEYALDVILRFNKEDKLVQWRYRGHTGMFDTPFTDLNCE